MERSNRQEQAPPPWPFATGELIKDPDDASALAQAIVDTIRDPLLVLDQDLRIVTANRSFLRTFRMDRQGIRGQPIYGLGDGQWDIPDLRLLLEEVASRHAVIEAYEVEQDFPVIGRRSLLLNARQVSTPANAHNLILLAIEDVTDRRAAEQQMAELLHLKDTLLQETRHRVANSLQIIASVLMLKAWTVDSEEARAHLQEAHDRVISVATVQQQLDASGHGQTIELGPYLSRLCDALTISMIGDSRPISLKVEADAGTGASAAAMSLGLITTELVINALKHGFPDAGSGGEILVRYQADEANWRLSVSDTGAGMGQDIARHGRTGLGTRIVEALAHQLKARVEIARGSPGMTVTIAHTG